MTGVEPIRLHRDEMEWLGVWVTDPPGQVFALSERPGYVWVATDAGTFHEVKTADLIVAEQGTLL